jgi:hypothetical protein
MTTLSIQPPFPLITDIDGQPLEDGYIWIGVANLPPIGNPIAVYWDAALTIPAALPVRTRGGYPVNAGTPARLYVGSDYSILVQNKNGSTLYSAPDGASDRFSAAQISFLQAGLGAVVRTAQSKMRDVVSVLDFGADPTGAASSVSAFNDALALGGTVHVPSGTYKLDGKVSMTVDGTTLYLAADVTLLLSGVPATQVPFGNQIHVIADDCAVIGSGPSSVLQITGGSQANAVGILHHRGFLVRDLTIDGDKANGSAITDDTFMSGVSIVATTASGATTDVNATVDNCEIRNFLQYGVNVYGDQANGVKVVNCNIHDNGKAGDALSVGAGIVVTRAVSDFCAANNVVKNNKQNGIFCSSAGQTGAYYNISNNSSHQNGGSGITFIEQSNYGSVAGQGLSGICITGNNCGGNTVHGIAVSTFDNVGLLTHITVTGNVCNGNTQYGIISQSNASPNNVAHITVVGNTTEGNGVQGVDISSNAADVEGALAYFTPVVRGTSSAGTATYASQLGTYIRTGNLITYQIFLDWSGHTGTGNLEVAGFPVAALNAEPLPNAWVWANGLTITGQATFGLVGNQTYGALGAINNGAYSAVAIDATATLRMSGSYFVND